MIPYIGLQILQFIYLILVVRLILECQVVPDTVSTENVNETYGNSNYVKPSSAGSESEKDGIERPKLNLKPRSQTIEQSQGNTGRDRSVTSTLKF